MAALTRIKDQAVKIFNAITDTGGNHLTPVAKLSINGKPFNTDALSRIISISLTDKSGFEADELTVSLSDHDGKLALPPKSAEITIALGYIETGIVDKGSYKITEVSWSGAPDTLHITAQSADTSDRFSEAKEKSWHKTSLKEIIESIAAANGYTPIIGKAYQDEKNRPHRPEQRIRRRLLVAPCRTLRRHRNSQTRPPPVCFIRRSHNRRRQPLPTIRITRNSGDQYAFRYSNTESYNAVRAYYIDKQTGKKHEVVITEDNYDPVKKTVTTTKKYKTKRKDGKTHKTTTKEVTEIKQVDTAGKKIKTLRHTYQSPKTAATGARAAYKKLKRGAMEFDISLAIGRPDVAPESPVTLQGFKPEIDAEKWVGKETVHTLDSNGLTTAVKLQSLIDVPIVLYEGEVSPNFAAAVSKP